MDYTDLKRRLRVVTGFIRFETGNRIAASACLSEEAADAIEALESRIESARIAELEAEVDRLQELLDLGPLGRMGLTLRTRKALRGAGIKTLDKLRQTDEATLLRIPNLGRKGLNDIRAALATHD